MITEMKYNSHVHRNRQAVSLTYSIKYIFTIGPGMMQRRSFPWSNKRCNTKPVLRIFVDLGLKMESVGLVFPAL